MRVAPDRTQIEEIDTLVPAGTFYSDYIVLTSRGCDDNCTFCASPFLWKRTTRFHSAGYVLAMLEQLVTKHGLCALAFKDDTFTADRDRVLEIGHGIKQRKLNFLWRCDTRVDALDEELLCAMRQAGCQRISFGIESAAPKILRSLNKKTTPDEIRTATSMAKKFGFQIRYYLIAGSRGETAETLSASIDFIKESLPSQYIFNPFTLIPGTKEFEIAERSGSIQRSMFFTDEFFELTPAPDAHSDPELQKIIDTLKLQPGVQDVWDYSVAECQCIVKLLPDCHAAHMDLAGALYREGKFAAAEKSIQQALDLDYPLPGLCNNYRACIAGARGDIKGMLENLIKAREYGFHQVVETNLQAVQTWLKAGGQQHGSLPELIADHHFEITSKKSQPVTPGPVTWHLQFSMNTLKPGLAGALARLFGETYLQQWTIQRDHQLKAAIAWQASSTFANILWLAAPPQADDEAVEALLLYARRQVPSRRPLSLDYPAQQSREAIQSAGFKA